MLHRPQILDWHRRNEHARNLVRAPFPSFVPHSRNYGWQAGPFHGLVIPRSPGLFCLATSWHSPHRRIAVSPCRPFAHSPYRPFALPPIPPYRPFALSPYRPFAVSPLGSLSEKLRNVAIQAILVGEE